MALSEIDETYHSKTTIIKRDTKKLIVSLSVLKTILCLYKYISSCRNRYGSSHYDSTTLRKREDIPIYRYYFFSNLSTNWLEESLAVFRHGRLPSIELYMLNWGFSK
ncbi:hypothetical protein CEXT_320061 [Caerostris extrusa]|uniref:Maturase K n=1 Tax=Caerostris extrusa TaxID=172846 RepID=A0AAV4X0Y2_CAEEX|nr:hypothetical protein CEXT_320061 [Caerostris extrusa]